MRGGKEEEKTTGPLFPRLSLNEIETGGPKAPPTNKMALYDPLSLPSDVMFSTSSSQDVGKERAAFLPFQSSPTPVHANGRQSSPPNNALSSNTSENSVEKTMSVLTFFHSGMSLDSTSNNQLVLNKENYFIGRTSSLQLQTSVTKSLKRSNSADLESQRHVRIRSGEVPWFPKASQDQVPESSNSQHKRVELGELNCAKIRGQSEVHIQENKVANGDSNRQPRIFAMGTANVLHRNEDLSNTSIGGCLSHGVLTPDDVVEAIGANQVWKARAEIIKQQKMFSKQVFELHRIIKVQNSLTNSPYLLQDVNQTCLGKLVNGTSFNKDILPKFIPEPPQSFVKVRNEMQKTKFIDDEQVANAPLVPSINNDHTTARITNFETNIEKSTMFNPCHPLGAFPPIPYGGYGITNTTTQCGDFFPNMPYGVLLYNPPMAMGPTYLTPYGMLVMSPSLSASTIEHMLVKQESCCITTSDINKSEGFVFKEGEKMENIDSNIRKMTSIDALPLFPAAPTAPDIESPVKTCCNIEQKPQVIRVIPRKPHIS